MLAELLDAPYIALATSLKVDGSTLTLQREIEGGEETVEVALPAVVSCQKGMAEARIPNMRGIMAARSKPLKVVEPIPATPLTQVAHYALPPVKAGVHLVSAENPEELVRILHEEAKII